jgi:head-tail adaptor
MSNWLDNVSTDFLSILTSMGDGIDVTLQKRVYSTNADGEQTITYSTVETGKGVVQNHSAQEREQDERLQGRLFHWIFFDTSEDVKPDWRFLVGSKVYNIEEPYALAEGVTVSEFRCTQVLVGTT